MHAHSRVADRERGGEGDEESLVELRQRRSPGAGKATRSGAAASARDAHWAAEPDGAVAGAAAAAHSRDARAVSGVIGATGLQSMPDWKMTPALSTALGVATPAEHAATAAEQPAVQRKRVLPLPDWAGGAASVQARGQLVDDDVAETARRGVADAGAALPHLEAIQASFGHHDLRGVRAQVGGPAAAAAQAIGAEAYATGERVAFASAPDLHTAAHEAAHVVQQRAGVQLAGGKGQLGDRYEQNADAVADRVVQGRSAEDLLPPLGGRAPASASSPAAAVQRAPGSGKGGRAEAVVTLPDKTLFDRKAYTPKPVTLGNTGEHTFIDKIIWVWDVPLRIKVTGNANLVGSFSGGLGAATLSNSFTYFDVKSLGPLQLAKLAAAEAVGQDVANAMMVLFMDEEGQEYTVHTRADLPADATANLKAEATLKGEIGDPLLLLAVGAWGSLTGSATATAKANAGMSLKAKYKSGKWTLEGSYDLDFFLGLFLSLSATIGAYVRLGAEGERKVLATQPKGMALAAPSDWPADVPFHGNRLDDADDPLAWRKEWKKTWPLWQKNWDKKWKVGGKFAMLSGGSDGDLAMAPESFPIGDVLTSLIDSPAEDQIPDKDPGPEPEKGPDAGRLAAAEAEARLAIDKARAAVDREREWNDEALKDAGAAASYKTALDARHVKLDSYKRAYISLTGKQHTAQRTAKSPDGPTRREALAQFGGLRASAAELQSKADQLAASRPKRINKYNAGKNGAGAKGSFGDFPDWNGYAMGASSHPANKELTLGGNGVVPQPSGKYAFTSGGDTTDGAGFVRTPWKTRMTRELDDRKLAHSGDEVAAKAELVSKYGVSSWDDLMLVDWEGHHIHEVSWGGARSNRSNVIFLRTAEHRGFTKWWDKRGADIVAEVAKDEP
jgi:Domain of unknown function (DUF4157)